MNQNKNFWSAWEERVSALRNVPPVLRIVWQSGRLVVASGLILTVNTFSTSGGVLTNLEELRPDSISTNPIVKGSRF